MRRKFMALYNMNGSPVATFHDWLLAMQLATSPGDALHRAVTYAL
ncbi:hypothetical protein [Pantoea sp. BJ2]